MASFEATVGAPDRGVTVSPTVVLHRLDQPLDPRSVRCSRDRYSALGLRLGNLAGADCTVHFSFSGATSVRCAAAISLSSVEPTVHLMSHLFAVVPPLFITRTIAQTHSLVRLPQRRTAPGRRSANRGRHLTQRPANILVMPALRRLAV